MWISFHYSLYWVFIIHDLIMQIDKHQSKEIKKKTSCFFFHDFSMHFSQNSNITMRIIFPLKSKPHSNPRRIAEILDFSQPFQTLFLNQFFTFSYLSTNLHSFPFLCWLKHSPRLTEGNANIKWFAKDFCWDR